MSRIVSRFWLMTVDDDFELGAGDDCESTEARKRFSELRETCAERVAGWVREWMETETASRRSRTSITVGRIRFAHPHRREFQPTGLGEDVEQMRYKGLLPER
jgi:hypothetical protein